MKDLTNTILVCLFLTLYGCVEEFEPTDTTLNPYVLVVDARLSNVVKRHELFITRSQLLQDTAMAIERGAAVTVKSKNQNYRFIDAGNGMYLSELPFATQPYETYQLEIVLSNGKKYLSNKVTSPGIAQLDEVNVERSFNDLNEEGLAIQVYGTGLEGATGFYRYEYEEAFKIIAPNWVPNDFLMTNYDPCALPLPTYDIEIIPEPYTQQICYGSNNSKRIIVNSTIGLEVDRVENFEILFLQRDNYYITHRYSLLVNQFVDTPEAYAFYTLLRDNASQENNLSGIQPGFVNGNMYSESDPDENVAGFFSVSTVSQKRIFFDYEDHFPSEEKPPYVDPCVLRSPPDYHVSHCYVGLSADPCPLSLPELLTFGEISFVGYFVNTPVPAACPGEYVVVNKVCGDCTVLGSNEKPDFWED